MPNYDFPLISIFSTEMEVNRSSDKYIASFNRNAHNVDNKRFPSM